MKVFISWSGQKSKQTAEILSSWIRQVIQSAETWISLDIDKGVRWNDKISKELEQTKIGIICLNKDNLTSEWILFEAGALSKTNDAHVCTFLLDITPSDVKPPLGQFQHTTFLKEDVKKLIHTINNKIILNGEKTIPEKDLDEVFEVFWPRLELKLNDLLTSASGTHPIQRTDRDILEEILQTVRTISKPNDLSKDFLFYYLTDDKSKKSLWTNKMIRNYILHSDIKTDWDDIYKLSLLKSEIDSHKESKKEDDILNNENDENDKDKKDNSDGKKE